MYAYQTKGVCSRQINVDMDGDVLKNVEFIGGCPGNLQGITKLVTGMRCDEIKAKLEGIKCGHKESSCPEQLVRAVEEAMAAQAD